VRKIASANSAAQEIKRETGLPEEAASTTALGNCSQDTPFASPLTGILQNPCGQGMVLDRS
jgi:hypothetical protein